MCDSTEISLCQKIENEKKCPCTAYECKQHGICCECIAKHRGRGQIPGCLFSEEGEKRHDRSLEAYLQDVKK
ncbi:MAG: DUF6485 family protein [Eubacterium sp.]